MVRRLPRIAAAVLCLLMLLGAEASHAGPLRPLVSRAEFFATDGERYAAWGNSPDDFLTVLDTVTGQRRRYPKPATCGIDNDYAPPPLGGHAVLWCGGAGPRQLALDLPTGKIITPPDTVTGPDGKELRGMDWYVVGRRWMEGDVDSSSTVYLDLVTGATRVLPPRKPVDLNRAGLTTAPLCRGLMPPSSHYWPDPYVEQQLQQLPDRLLDRYSGLILRSCHRRPIALAKGRISSPRIAADLVSWTDGIDAVWGDSSSDRPHPRDALKLYSLASHKKRQWRLPHLRVSTLEGVKSIDAGLSWHTRTEVFWAAMTAQECGESDCLPTQFRVYSARIRKRS